jgi:hypothetical protein
MNISLSKHSNSASEIYITSRFLYLKHSLGVLSFNGVGSCYCEFTLITLVYLTFLLITLVYLTFLLKSNKVLDKFKNTNIIIVK